MPASRLNRLFTDFADNVLGRILGLKKHEYIAVAWSFAYLFCVLSSYYILRPVRETMAVGSGPDTILWLFTGTFVVMLTVTPIFGWVASRYPRRRFLPWVYLFFISNIIIFWGIFSFTVDREVDHIWLGRVFFVWLSVFNLFVVSVFWSFMADIYTREQGRRLFGVITAGGSIGALAGGIATSSLETYIGFHNLFPIAAVLLMIAILCITRLRSWIEQSPSQAVSTSVTSAKPLGGKLLAGVTHVFASRYFTAIAVSLMIASLLGTALYILMAQLVEQNIANVGDRIIFFADVNNATNALALVLQLLIVKRVVHRFGIGVSLSLMPIASIVGFIILAVDPVLGVITVFTVLRRALGFGFSKPTSDMLYSVVTPEEKYKTKNFIDTAVYRSGDVIAALALRVLAAIGLGMAAISIVMLPFAALWATISLWLGRDYRRQAKILRENEAS